MPIAPTYPGVYIEEIPSGVRTITGVSTSIAAFIDFFKRGPRNQAVQIFNMGDFDREFGGLDTRSEASYAIQQFFLNGGTEAWVVRVASGSVEAATVEIDAGIAGSTALTVTAINEGEWANGNVRVRVDPAPTTGEFNLTVSLYETVGSRIAVSQQEVFRNLSMDSTRSNFVDAVVNDVNTGSKLVRVEADGSDPPLANGTVSDEHPGDPTLPASADIVVTIADGTTSVTSDPVPIALAAGAHSLTAIAPALESAIRAAQPANPLFADATVSVVGQRLRILAGAGNPGSRVTFGVGSSSAADDLLLTTGSIANAQEYVLGTGAVANTAQSGGTAGDDGDLPDGLALIGDLLNKRGMYALEDVDLFNLLCIPRASMIGGSDGLSANEASTVLSTAETYCEKRRAFLLIDTPPGIDEPQEIKNQLAAIPIPRHRNAALYYPRVQIADPLNDFRLRSIGASGTIAGLYARTDSNRGVWKAPAGTEAVLRNVPRLDDVLTDPENGTLNPLAINCIRTFPVYGTVSWGARTLDGSDQLASEWKYVPVRRLALYLEESLYRGLKWVVFEPNDEALWAQIRLNVGAFMNNLFRQGAFQGTSPREAYLVKCDRETTTQNDINLGIVNIVVGFAPLKPAEFVIVKIQQLAGQIAV